MITTLSHIGVNQTELPPRVICEDLVVYKQDDLNAALASLKLPSVITELSVFLGYYSHGTNAEKRSPDIYLPYKRMDHAIVTLAWPQGERAVRVPIGSTPLWLANIAVRQGLIEYLPGFVGGDVFWDYSLIRPHHDVLSNWLNFHLPPDLVDTYVGGQFLLR